MTTNPNKTYKAMLNVCIVAGARPNFVKVAPLVWAISQAQAAGHAIGHKLIYTGAERELALDPSLFADLQTTPPDVCLGAEGSSLNEIAGMVMGSFDRYLAETPTDVVVVVDDLAATMSAAIAAKRRGVRLAHLVAGTRSFDMGTPKESNRLVIDGLSDLLFTAGHSSSSAAAREGVPMSHIYMVGNILMDALRHCRHRHRRPQVLQQMAVADGQYIALTLNSPALIADHEQLRAIMETIAASAHGTPIVAVLRDEAMEAVGKLGVNAPSLTVTRALPYLEFGYLAAHAMGIITDSGNVAEEATFNGVPCATLSTHAEHPETVSQGTNVLVGHDTQMLAQAVENMTHGKWKYGSLPDMWDGRTAERIVKILEEKPWRK